MLTLEEGWGYAVLFFAMFEQWDDSNRFLLAKNSFLFFVTFIKTEMLSKIHIFILSNKWIEREIEKNRCYTT